MVLFEDLLCGCLEVSGSWWSAVTWHHYHYISRKTCKTRHQTAGAEGRSKLQQSFQVASTISTRCVEQYSLLFGSLGITVECYRGPRSKQYVFGTGNVQQNVEIGPNTARTSLHPSFLASGGLSRRSSLPRLPTSESSLLHAVGNIRRVRSVDRPAVLIAESVTSWHWRPEK